MTSGIDYYYIPVWLRITNRHLIDPTYYNRSTICQTSGPKLTIADVRGIRDGCRRGLTQITMARTFRTSRTIVGRIMRGEIYHSVTDKISVKRRDARILRDRGKGVSIRILATRYGVGQRQVYQAIRDDRKLREEETANPE